MYIDTDDNIYDVELMNVVVDKADGLRVVDSDSHFSEFAGVHPSKIKQGKLFLHDIIKPTYREKIMQLLCKKNSPYVYFDAEFINKAGEEVLIHCTGHNYEGTTLCRLTLADVSKSVEKQQQLRDRAKEMNYLIDLVSGGVCLFKVTPQMHIEVLYLNEAGCRLFGTSKTATLNNKHRLDDIIHPEDKSLVFQAIGKAMATDGNIDMEFRTIVHKNEYRWCKLDAGIQKYDEDNTPIFHAMLTDISKIKETEERADQYNEQLVHLFKNLPDPIFYTDAENVFKLQIVSEDFIKFLGYTRSYIFEEHEGRLDDFIQDREIAYAEATIKRQIAEGRKETLVRYSIRTKSGTYIVVEDKRTVVKQENGGYTLVCRLQNVTQNFADIL